MPTPLHTPGSTTTTTSCGCSGAWSSPATASTRATSSPKSKPTRRASRSRPSSAGFVLAVIPQLEDMIDVGSVLMWLGSRRGRAVPAGGVGRPSPRQRRRRADRQGGSAAREVRTARVRGALPAARGSAPRTSKTTSRRRASARPRRAAAARRAPGPRRRSDGAWDVAGAHPGRARDAADRALAAGRGGAGYVELEYDAAAWDRIAADYPAAGAAAAESAAGADGVPAGAAATENRGLASTIVGDQRFVYDHVNLGFTVQTETALYLTVVEKADDADLPASSSIA